MKKCNIYIVAIVTAVIVGAGFLFKRYGPNINEMHKLNSVKLEDLYVDCVVNGKHYKATEMDCLELNREKTR